MRLDDETKRAVLIAVAGAAAGAAATALATAVIDAAKHIARPLWREFGPRDKGGPNDASTGA